MLPIRTILYATDLSEESRTAFQYANGLARDYGARLVLLTVYPLPVEDEPPQNRDRHQVILDELRVKLCKQLKPDPSLRVDYRVMEGRPDDAILDVANEVGADLIVMATYGESGPHHLVMGSVTEAVNRGACCPVLAVRGELMPISESSSSCGAKACAAILRSAGVAK